ncbi:activating molecule in BECN1-regulated autophagy protein 1B-like isoform X1 [Saccostrea cucullata]|uniref:activating molecule in BECN1-regulated autophagy protein 1B-like isoform X1 n=1 Tax=Saccostrea cuccullata TaxID=36930 RepID=UPI002ED0590F
MDFSPDGTKVASTHGDHTVRVSEVATGKCLHILRGHPRTPWCLAFHPSSNQILASGCLGGEVRIWDLHGCGTEVWRSKDSQVITSLTFHPTDHVLVFSVTNHIYFWDWSQPDPFVVCKTKYEFEKIRWVKFDPLGSYLYTGIANNITVRPTSRVSFISSNSNTAPPNPRTQQLGNVYDGLVECFQASRRDRVLNQTEGGQDPPSSSSVQHGASNHPHSPVHEEGLNLARQYASHITESSQRSTYGGPQRTDIPSGASNDSSSPDTDMDVISSPAEPRMLRNPPRAASAENDVSGETTPDVLSTDIEPSQTRAGSNSDRTSGTLVVTERSPEQASPPFQSLDPPPGVRIVSESQAMNENVHSRLGNQVHASTVAFNVAPEEERAEEIVNLSDIASRGLSDSDLATRGLFSSDVSQHSNSTDCERDNCPVCGNFNTRHLRRVCESEMFTQLRARRRSLQNSINNASARSAFSRPYFYNRHGSLIRPEVHSIHDPSQLGEMHEIRRVENPNAGASNVDNATSNNNNNVPSNTEGDARLTQVGDNIDICASIHENFASITARIEREMNELDRRINNLRNTFNESLRRLQHHRVSFLSAREGDVNGRRPTSFLVARHVPQAEGASASRSEDSTHSMERGQHLLETALRSSQQDITSTHTHSAPRDPDSSQNWQSLERHHLHPHYSVSILDNTINRPNDPIQSAINRAIADAFMGRGEPAVAANIINHTYRIQAWDFTKCCIPDLTDTKSNIIVQHCKLHNEASCNLSQDGTMLATFVPSHRGFPDDNILAVYSLETRTRGQCLYTKSFGPNAISVSLSPGCDYVMVGLAAKQLSWVFTPNQLVAQILKLENKHAGEKSMQHVTDVMHPCDMDIRTHVSVNSTRWLPESGEGIVYGTNRGDLHICRPGTKMSTKGDNSDDRSIRRNLMHMLRMSGEQEVSRINSSTQTPGVRRSAATQTDTEDST